MDIAAFKQWETNLTEKPISHHAQTVTARLANSYWKLINDQESQSSAEILLSPGKHNRLNTAARIMHHLKISGCRDNLRNLLMVTQCSLKTFSSKQIEIRLW